METAPSDKTLAVFIDFENLALGFKDRKSRFKVKLVLERFVEKGKIIVKKAYADWHRYSDYKTELHEHAIDLIEIPRRALTGKNSADIRMVVDVLDLCYSKEHINTFALVSGDSDMSPLVSKLKENGKHVIGLGMKDSTSKLLVANCDEFIFYEDLETKRRPPTTPKNLPKKKAEAFDLLIDSIDALLREDKEILWGSMIKQTMKRKKPEFSEGYVGYGSFSELLEDAEKQGLITITKDARSGTYVITGYGKKGPAKKT